MSKRLNQLNQLFDKYKGLTNGAFHTALWELMVNQPERTNAAFVFIAVPNEEPGNIGVVDFNERGYTPAPFSINEDVPEAQRKQMIAELNLVVFNKTEKEAASLALRSMAFVP